MQPVASVSLILKASTNVDGLARSRKGSEKMNQLMAGVIAALMETYGDGP